MPDGDRVVYRQLADDVYTQVSPKETCKRHVLLVLNAFNADLTGAFMEALNDSLAALEKPKGRFTEGPAWIDPYLYPLVTDDQETAVLWLMEKI